MLIDYINEMKRLVSKLNRYRDAYYNENRSIVTDREYDEMFDRLVELEGMTETVLSNSPTQNVGYEVVSGLKKVKHNHPLLSLAKTTDIDEFHNFFGDRRYVLMAKLDGLTCSMHYKNGELIRAETRGDGEIGEDITHNARMFSNLPLHIDYSGELIVDGECIITNDEFYYINQRENTEYKNARNLVSGTVRQLNNEVVKNRNVKFIAWKLFYADKFLDLHSKRLSNLINLGFDVVPFHLINADLSRPESKIDHAIESIKQECEKLCIPIDGMVGMFDSDTWGKMLGNTNHHPKHSLAYKFYQEENETVLKDIEWTTSRTGLINPVAVFEPVEIDGTTVSRATLNNVSFIKDMDLGVGDTITVIKANQIIPQITQNLTRSGTYKIPTECPTCHMPSVIKNDNGREMLYCSNSKCPAILHDRISNFAARNGMNIVGISEERLKALIDIGYITNFRDLYYLKDCREEIVKLDGFGESSVDNILQAIEDSRKCTLTNILVAIGIPNIGKSTARTIAEFCEKKYSEKPQYYDNPFDCFLDCVEYWQNWSKLPAIGMKTSETINCYVSENMPEISVLLFELEVGLEFEGSEEKIHSVLNNQTFCITGKLEFYDNRNELVAEIEKLGGKVSSSVTSKTNYLITNDKNSGSSKNQKAQKYGTKIISEQEFRDLIYKNV